MVYLTYDDRAMSQQEPVIGGRNGWFARQQGITAEDAQAVLTMVVQWARKHFHDNITMQRTPTGFSIELLLHSLPEMVQYEPIPPDAMSVLHGAVPLPHRVEYFQRGQKGIEHDARVAYLAYCRHVPVYFRSLGTTLREENTKGEPVNSFYQPYRPGWYKCDVTVPTTWQHIGLVPAEKIMIGEQPTYRYHRKGGEQFTSWLHESEVCLLKEHEWSFTIRERMLFAQEEKGLKGLDPLRAWQERLASGIMGCEAQWRETHDRKWSLMRDALRSVALNLIGQFMFDGQGKITYEIVNGQIVGHAPGDLTPYLARYHHPEWFCAVTARTRVATTRLALKVPLKELISIKADAVVTKYPLSGLTDKGIGSYRVKGAA